MAKVKVGDETLGPEMMRFTAGYLSHFLFSTFVILCVLCGVDSFFLLNMTRAAAAEPTADTAVAEMDRLWADRGNAASIERAIAIGTARSHPPSYELAWRLGRLYWRKGDLAATKEQRRDLYAQARQFEETAIALEPGRVEGHLYYGLSTGDYGGTVSIVRALAESIASKLEQSIQRAYQIDRDFDHGSPMLALGRYYFELPWPKRDLDQSLRYLEELKQRHPDLLLGRLYLADTYRALGRNDAAKAELQFVLTHEPLPDRRPEESDIKADAQQRLQEWFGESHAAAKQEKELLR
jgi:tetratricopeptide (TPR) repeat protein